MELLLIRGLLTWLRLVITAGSRLEGCLGVDLSRWLAGLFAFLWTVFRLYGRGVGVTGLLCFLRWYFGLLLIDGFFGVRGLCIWFLWLLRQTLSGTVARALPIAGASSTLVNTRVLVGWTTDSGAIGALMGRTVALKKSWRFNSGCDELLVSFFEACLGLVMALRGQCSLKARRVAC